MRTTDGEIERLSEMPADGIGAAAKKGLRHVPAGSSAVRLHHFRKRTEGEHGRLRGLEQRDAENITQAVCNDCDVFLTRDKGIIKHCEWLEQRFSKLKVWLPSELLAFIRTG